MRQFLHQYKRQLAALALSVLLFSLLPIADTYHAVGSGWRGIPSAYSDEEYYYARIKEVADGLRLSGIPTSTSTALTPRRHSL